MKIRRLNREVDPATTFAILSADSDYAFWLDSARRESPMSRFSYVGVVPDSASVLRVEEAAEEQDDPWRLLATRLENAPSVDGIPSSLEDLKNELLGGFVGYFGYEARRSLDFSTPFHAETPDALWMPAVRYLVWDHRHSAVYAVGEETWLSQLEEHLDSAEQSDLTNICPLNFPKPHRGEYEADVRSSLHEIFEGNSYEVCLTAETRTVLPTKMYNDKGILSLYCAQRNHNPAPYAALLKCADHWVLSSSPERFLTVDSSRAAETKPIKGTVPRTTDPVKDQALADWLSQDPKTRAENLMIVDLLRNDLSKVSLPGSVHVPVLMGVESYATVHQLVSTVASTLRPEVNAVEAAASCFPGGSMTGAPKPSTMEIIDRLEARARGVYSGTLGFFSATGAANLSIVIRTLVILDGGEVALSAGGAIVADSDPGAEYEEMLTKLSAAVPVGE